MKKHLLTVMVWILLISLAPSVTSAQSGSRTYANFQGVLRTGLYVLGVESVFGQINGAGKAIDGDVTTYSVPNIPAGLLGLASVTQYLGFTNNGTLGTVRQISAGVPVSIKISLPQSLIGLADNVEIGVYTGLQPVAMDINGALGTGGGNAAGHRASNTTPLYSGSTLINVLNGAGEAELTLTPSQPYEGIYVKLSGNVLSLALSMQVYHAYIIENNPVPCASQGNVIDILSGIRGNALVNLLSATGSVSQPWSAVDAGASALNTYATISTGVQVLSEAFETVVFNTTARAGDSLQLIIEDPGAQLLDLNLLGSLKIIPYNGATAGTTITTAQIGLSLRLLSSASRKYILSVPVSTAFDRVTVSMGGVANVLSQLRVYDVKRSMPVPVVSANTGVREIDTITVYKGSSLQLSASSADPVTWYSSAGTWLGNGPTYSIPSAMADGVYVATAVRNGCSQTTSSYTVYLKVIDHLTLPLHELVFTGQAEKAGITVQWTAKGEYAVNHYTLQKREPDGGFADIATIFALGNYTDAHYLFPDKSPAQGTNIYRLAIHEQSGAVSYSSTIQIVWNKDLSGANLNIFPNPINRGKQLFLDGLDTGTYLITVIGSAGQICSETSVSINRVNERTTIETNHLQPGLYWLRATPLKTEGTRKIPIKTVWIR